MLSRFFDRWAKSREFTSNELAILRLLLPVECAYSDRLFSQAVRAPYVQRKRTGRNGYEAIIPYVVDDSMLIECEENVNSPTISVTTPKGIPMYFSTTILRGGFLSGLKGQTSEGTDWPKDSIIDIDSARIPNDISTWIPKPITEHARTQVIEELSVWCGIDRQNSRSIKDKEFVRITEPASNAIIRVCEDRLRIRLCEQYIRMVSITNGFGITRGRPYEFLGTLDLYYINGAREWLCLTPLYEDGCVAIQCKEGVATNECYLLSGGGTPIHVGDIKQHIRDSLNWNNCGM